MSLLTSEEEPETYESALGSHSQSSAAPKGRPSKGDFKIALKTVLKALDYNTEEIEERVKKDPNKQLKVHTKDMLAALPHMDRAEKKALYQALKAEQEAIAMEALEREPQPSAEKMRRPERRSEGYRALEDIPKAKSLAAPSGSASSAAAPPDPEKDLPGPVKKKQLETFRRALHDSALNRRGQLKPSQASEYPTGEQEVCPHDFGDLRWGANASAHWAHCRRCRLKRVLYYSHDHGAMAANTEVSPDHDVMSTMGPSLAPGEVIVDTGCRTAVAGCSWHKQHQDKLRALGLKWLEAPQDETFRFGAGPPIRSTVSFIYPVYTHGACTWVRISEVGGDAQSCPGLIGPSEMSRWGVQLHFATRKMVVLNEERDMRLSVTRHPVLQLLELTPEHADMSYWDTAELQELLQTLLEKTLSNGLL